MTERRDVCPTCPLKQNGSCLLEGESGESRFLDATRNINYRGLSDMELPPDCSLVVRAGVTASTNANLAYLIRAVRSVINAERAYGDKGPWWNK